MHPIVVKDKSEATPHTNAPVGMRGLETLNGWLILIIQRERRARPQVGMRDEQDNGERITDYESAPDGKSN